ncbi:LOW QUALITY PROTEIN: exportin-6 [Bufo gargarizans]|uniref:LOW QUALITY PROTEIN: exportin-6 n=1 Tax=Bufo gargarizans TaxID=30331 RepID=UPI001CF1EA62|nr:LOW QUALITY PROTEIN: exportin-6 [Bufo gargarizans]
MASEEASLRALEGLMSEFFHTSTSNDRKREIEALLNNFAQQLGAWRFCFYFLSSSHNDYVLMYSLSVFENLINKMWLGVPSEEKMEIRSSLPKLLLSQHKALPGFICNKLCKVIVDMGRQDWPMFYHDFFTNILQLIQSPRTTSLGLIMLKTASEELACPREDLSVARKEELRKLLLEQVPNVLGLLTGVLESIWDKHSVTTATPPPSPTAGEAGTDLLSNLVHTPALAKQLSQPPPSLEAESERICALALECLSHLFSWIPLSASITPSLLTTIFHFARLGCDTRSRRTHTVNNTNAVTMNGGGSSSPPIPLTLPTSQQDCNRLGVLAMSCINELMCKNCVPLEFQEYLLRVCQQTFYLLQRITRETNAHSVRSRLEELDESYVEKFTDFLRLFVSVHLRRIESNAQFPVVEFLSLLFKYTFHQPTHEGYLSCLDIWALFLDYLTNKIRNRLEDREAIIGRYEDALVLLLTEVLNRIQFRYNQTQLEELDDETLDDDQQTEWQRYLRHSLEVVAKIMELLPTHAFSTLFAALRENLDVYLGLQQCIVTTGGEQRLNVTAENDCRRLHCSLRDLSSLLQAVGRLAEYFIGDVFEARFNDALTVVERLVKVTLYGSELKPYNMETAVPSVLKPDLVDVHAQSLAALQAYSHWLARFYSEVQHQNPQQFVSIISTAMEALPTLISSKVQEKLLLSACHLLVSVASTVRPVFLLNIPAVQKVFNRVTDSSAQRLPEEAQVLLCRALSNILLLPWPNVSEAEQQWAERSSHHASLLNSLTRDYRQLKGSAPPQRKGQHEATKRVICQTLGVLKDIVENISGEGTKSRQICYQSMQESAQLSLALFPTYIHQSDVTEEMLSFFLALFQGLRVQMGVPFTEQIIQTFLNMFTREQLAESLLQEGSAGCHVVERFLKILQVVVQEPGPAFKPFLPNILSLCMEQLYPIIAERPSPDVKAELFELLFQLLHHNWRYFYRSSVLASVHRDGGGDEPMENQAQFIGVMQAFGQSFLQPDIHVFKQNLGYLETLNSKHKLYHKKLFRAMMLPQFVSVLLQVLIHKSHDLLQEEIGIAVYNMASVDFSTFFSAFLPEFLAGCQGIESGQKNVLARNFKIERDLPSFTQCVHRLVNDLRYYRLCNDSLPPGTVKL